MEKHETFSVLVENRFGVLTRVAGLFSGRGFNIDSLTVSPTENPDYSRMTIVTHGDNDVLEQIEKQLSKLIEVVKVNRLTDGGFVARELMLVKVKATEKRGDIIQIAGIFKGQVVDVQLDSLVIQVTGASSKLNAFVSLMEPFGIIELARTGSVALPRKEQEEPDDNMEGE